MRAPHRSVVTAVAIVVARVALGLVAGCAHNQPHSDAVTAQAMRRPHAVVAPPAQAVQAVRSDPVDPLAMGHWRRHGRSAFAPVRPFGATTTAIVTDLGARPAGQPIIDAQDTVYVATRDGRLHARTSDGAVRVIFDLKQPVTATPALSPLGHLHLAGERGTLVQLDAQGQERWRVQVTGGATADLLVGPDGTVYVAGQGVSAFDTQGERRFHYPTADQIHSAPVLHPDGMLIFGTLHGRLLALSLDGRLRWELSAGSAVTAGPSVTEDGSIVIGNLLGQLLCLSAAGELRWSFDSEQEYALGSAASSHHGTIAVGSQDGALYLLSPDGVLQRRVPLGGRLNASPRFDAQATLFIGSSDQMLYAISGDGAIRWSYNAGQAIREPVAVGRDGTIYAVADHGMLLAFY